MPYAGFGTLPPVGGPFACPGCLTGIPGFNPYFGTFGAIPPFGPIAPIPPYNKGFGTWGAPGPIGAYPGICTGCV